jgi:hypothetical protein
VGEMPRGVEAVLCTVLAHGADPDAVLHSHAPDLEGSEQLWDWFA